MEKARHKQRFCFKHLPLNKTSPGSFSSRDLARLLQHPWILTGPSRQRIPSRGRRGGALEGTEPSQTCRREHKAFSSSQIRHRKRSPWVLVKPVLLLGKSRLATFTLRNASPPTSPHYCSASERWARRCSLGRAIYRNSKRTKKRDFETPKLFNWGGGVISKVSTWKNQAINNHPRANNSNFL